MRLTIIILAIIAFSTIIRSSTADICSDAIANAPPGAAPKLNTLRFAAIQNDIHSACLLLKAGADVNEPHDE
jgi:hypothetical protein